MAGGYGAPPGALGAIPRLRIPQPYHAAAVAAWPPPRSCAHPPALTDRTAAVSAGTTSNASPTMP